MSDTKTTDYLILSILDFYLSFHLNLASVEC